MASRRLNGGGAAAAGARVRLWGQIRLAPHTDPLSSPGGHPCVYFKVRDPAGAEPERVEVRDFYLDHTGGSVLVMMEPGRCRVEAEVDQNQEAMSVLDADIAELSHRIKEMKETMRAARSEKLRALVPTRRRLRELATLLCSIRAHAHHKIHGGRRTRDQQATLIRKLSAKFQDADDIAWVGSFELFAPRYEVILAEGDEVTVEGVGHQEPDPDPAAARDYRGIALRLVLRAPPGGQLCVKERSAPAGADAGPAAGPDAGPAAQLQREGGELDEPGTPEARGRHLWWWLAATGAALVGLAYWLMGG